MGGEGGLSLERIESGDRYFVTSGPDRVTVWDGRGGSPSPVAHFPLAGRAARRLSASSSAF